MSWLSNVARKIRSVLPGGSRTHASADETTPLLQKTNPNAQIPTEIDAILAKVVKLAGRRAPEDAAKYASNAFSNTQSHLFKIIKPGDLETNTAIGRTAARFVAEGLARLAPRDLTKVLGSFSPSDLAQICAVDIHSDRTAFDTKTAVRIARNEMSARNQKSLTDMQKSSAALLNLPQTLDLRSPDRLRQLLGALDNLAQSTNKLQALCTARNEALPAPAERTRKQAADHVRALLTQSEPSLAALSNAEISKLRGALKVLDVRLDPAQLEEAALKRTGPIEASCQAAASAVVRGALVGSPSIVLRGLKDLEASFNTLRDTKTSFSNELSGADDSLRLRRRILASALAPLTSTETIQLAKALHSPEMGALREGIYAASSAASEIGLDDQSTSLNALGAYLEESTMLVDEARGRAPTTQRGDAPELSPAARDAFRDVLGIEWMAGGQPVFQV